MKFGFLTAMCLISFSAFASAEISQEQKDFFIVCESSKFAKALKKNPAFQDAAERAVLVSKMQQALVASEAVKNSLSAIAQAHPSEKSKLLKQAAADVGLKKWKCPTLHEL